MTHTKKLPDSCQDERCSVCGIQAWHKVEEDIFECDSNPIRHPLSAYLCCEHFKMIVRHSSCEFTNWMPAVEDVISAYEWLNTGAQADSPLVSIAIKTFRQLIHELPSHFRQYAHDTEEHKAEVLKSQKERPDKGWTRVREDLKSEEDAKGLKT